MDGTSGGGFTSSGGGIGLSIGGSNHHHHHHHDHHMSARDRERLSTALLARNHPTLGEDAATEAPPPDYDSAVSGALTSARLPAKFTIFQRPGAAAGGRTQRFVAVSEVEPLNCVELRDGLINIGKPGVTVRCGASAESPVLATGKSATFAQGQGHVLSVFSSAMSSASTSSFAGDGGEGVAAVEERMRAEGLLGSTKYRFLNTVGRGESKRERLAFEWRRTKGPEVGMLGAGRSGWKLVKIGAESRIGNTREEVVAVWAEYGHKSMSEPVEFQFMGAGARGDLGDEWRVLALTSMLVIWWGEMTEGR